MHKGEAGIKYLNQKIQNTLTSKHEQAFEKKDKSLQLNIGDKVRHGTKSYELLVDLETYKIDSFSSVDSGSHVVNQATNPSGTVPTSAQPCAS